MLVLELEPVGWWYGLVCPHTILCLARTDTKKGEREIGERERGREREREKGPIKGS